MTITGVDGRPFFVKRFSTLSDVILLTNTDQGGNWTVSYELRRPFQNGWFFSTAYSYNDSRSVMDVTSDQAASAWGNTSVPGDSNNQPLTRSSFDLYWIVVCPDRQGAGLGRRLLALVEAAAFRQGGARLYAETSSRPLYAPTRAFYRATGFDPAAELPDFYAPGDGKLVFAKRLAPAP